LHQNGRAKFPSSSTALNILHIIAEGSNTGAIMIMAVDIIHVVFQANRLIPGIRYLHKNAFPLGSRAATMNSCQASDRILLYVKWFL